MNPDDPTIERIRRAKHEISASFGHDPRKMGDFLMEQQKQIPPERFYQPPEKVSQPNESDVTPKRHFIAILQRLPDDSTHEELLRELAFARMVDRGLKDVEEGRIMSNEYVKRRILKIRGTTQ